MSEETVTEPVGFKKALKALGAAAARDLAKWQGSLTSVSNALFVGVAIWTLIGPYFENKGAVNASAQVASLQVDLSNAVAAKEAAEGLAVENRKGYEAVKQDAAKLSLDLDACRSDPPAKEVKPAEKHEASLTPTVKKVRTKPVLPPKADPTLYEQFVAWYEANVTPPGVN